MDERERDAKYPPITGTAEPDIDDPIEETRGAEDAVQDMVAHERRRDQTYRTTGDDHSDGSDVDIDSNAPKDDELPRKKNGGSRGKSDWE